jgi:hypothetical protein
LSRRPSMPSRLFLRLESCPSLFSSCAPLQRRFQSGVVLKGDLLGPVHQDAHQSFRERKHGKPLPLPPLLDEVVLAERSRWEQPKAKPDVNKFTPFQKKLWENPYGPLPLSEPQRYSLTLASSCSGFSNSTLRRNTYTIA